MSAHARPVSYPGAPPLVAREAQPLSRGPEYLSRAARTARCRQLARRGFLIARVGPASDASTDSGSGILASPLQRGRLREAIHGSVEIALALRGATPARREIDDAGEAAEDQIRRVISVDAPGLCVLLPSLQRLASPGGALSEGDTEALRVWTALGKRHQVVLVLDADDRTLHLLAPTPILDVLGGSWMEDDDDDDDATTDFPPPPDEPETMESWPPRRRDTVPNLRWPEPAPPSTPAPRPRRMVPPPTSTRPWRDLPAAEPSWEEEPVAGVAERTVLPPPPPERAFVDDEEAPPDAEMASAPDWAPRLHSVFDEESEIDPDAPSIVAAPVPSAPAPAARPATPMLDPATCARFAHELAAAAGPKPVRIIEELFRTRYMPLLEVIGCGHHETAAHDAVARWSSSFEKSYTDAFTAIRVTGKRPTMVLDAPEQAARLARLHGARGVQLLLVDAMRFDLGQRTMESLRERLGDQGKLVGRSLLWSALPTTTPAQMNLLARGPRGLSEAPPSSDRDPVVQRGRSVTTLRRVRIGQRDLLKLDVVEARLREAGLPFEQRLAALADETSAIVAAYARSLPPKTLLYLFGDHGFVLDGDARGTDPATQGGASPEEVLVPAYGWMIGD